MQYHSTQPELKTTCKLLLCHPNAALPILNPLIPKLVTEKSCIKCQIKRKWQEGAKNTFRGLWCVFQVRVSIFLPNLDYQY